MTEIERERELTEVIGAIEEHSARIARLLEGCGSGREFGLERIREFEKLFRDCRRLMVRRDRLQRISRSQLQSRDGTREEWIRLWQFNIGKFRNRYDGEEPVVPRDRDECRAFLQMAFDKYSASIHQPLLEAAIYALLNHEMTLEVNVARLFSAIQGALYFATQRLLNPKGRPPIGELHRDFLAAHPGIFDGLWPLLGSQTDAPLYYLRNAIVHGEAFSEVDWTALSYAGEHLRWHLERIILAALGWDIEKSKVSNRVLSLFTAYQAWTPERDRLAAGLVIP
jgi:hypothetical protein